MENTVKRKKETNDTLDLSVVLAASDGSVGSDPLLVLPPGACVL